MRWTREWELDAVRVKLQFRPETHVIGAKISEDPDFTHEIRLEIHVVKGSEGPLKFGDPMVSHFQGIYW
jgi:hypothetical protein